MRTNQRIILCSFTFLSLFLLKGCNYPSKPPSVTVYVKEQKENDDSIRIYSPYMVIKTKEFDKISPLTWAVSIESEKDPNEKTKLLRVYDIQCLKMPWLRSEVNRHTKRNSAKCERTVIPKPSLFKHDWPTSDD